MGPAPTAPYVYASVRFRIPGYCEMTYVVDLLIAGALVIVVLAGTYAIVDHMSRRRVEQDFKDPKDVLEAVDVYLQYGRKRTAVQLLRRSLERNPSDPALRARLTELTAEDV